MEIKHSKRILFLGNRGAGVLDIVKDLTGTAPSADINHSIAGLIHSWHAQTAYYSAHIPIWIDEIPDLPAWKTTFLGPEAEEVVRAVGAWIYCYSSPPSADQNAIEVEEAVKSIREVVDRHGGGGGDVVFLAVERADTGRGVGRDREEHEDVCMRYGFEHVDYGAAGRNEFGEKVGLERLKEALEAHEWGAGEESEGDSDELEFGEGEDGFGREGAEMTTELFGMKAALGGGENVDPEDLVTPQSQERGVEDLDSMLGKLLAVKEQSADLPEEQRKRMAAEAVRALMRDHSNV